MAINAQELQGQWNQIRGKLKERWGQLTDDDLQIQGGNVDQLVGRIQTRTGEGREAIERALNEMLARGSSTVAAAAGSVGQFAQQAAGRLRENYGQLGDRARERFGHMADQARDSYESVEEMVRQSPGQTVMVAFGVGLVVGLVAGLAMRSR